MNIYDAKELIDKRRFVEAKKAINELKKQGVNTLSVENRYNKKLKESHKSLESKIIINIKESIKKGDYSKIFNTDQKLKAINFNSRKVSRLVDYAAKKYFKLLEKAHKNQITTIHEEIDSLIKDKLFKEALNKCYEFIRSNKWTLENNFNKRFIQETKRKIIDSKYNNNKRKLKEHTLITQFEFIKKLYLIDTSYQFTQKKLYQYQKKLKKYDKLRKKIILKEALLSLRVLFYQKKI